MNTLKKYGAHYNNEEFKKMANKYNKEQVTNNPFAGLLALLFVFFVVELLVLGNLWAVNAIADYF